MLDWTDRPRRGSAYSPPRRRERERPWQLAGPESPALMKFRVASIASAQSRARVGMTARASAQEAIGAETRSLATGATLPSTEHTSKDARRQGLAPAERVSHPGTRRAAHR